MNQYTITDLLNIEQLDSLLNQFSNITGIGTALLEYPSQQVLIATGWQDICTNFHRYCKESAQNCYKSDNFLSSSLMHTKDLIINHCNNGLIDGCAPIIVDGEHLATIFTGQVLFDPPDIELFKGQAKKYNYDETAYLEALKKVPIINEEQFIRNLKYLQEMAVFIADQALTNKLLNNTQVELMQKEKELKAQNKELKQFIYVASHDLQEPLRTISSFVQLLELKYKHKLDKEGKDFLDFIIEAAKRMHNQINDLLSLSRIGTQAKPFEMSDMNNIIEKLTKTFYFQIRETKATITYDKLPKACIDKGQIYLLYQNLISNALKFNKNEPFIHLSVDQEDKEWVFSVKDNGIGIPQQYSEKIFEIFQRLHSKSEYDGTGIGLAICKKIVERHNGKIWLKSEPDKGTTFYFTLPVSIKNKPNKEIEFI